jgi:hypothetical protein
MWRRAFDLIMNESEIFSKDKSEKDRFKWFETLHLILKNLH